MSEPATLVTQAAIDMLLLRLQEDGVAYHYAPVSASRRASFKEVTRLTIMLEEILGVPVFFDRMGGNHFELWVGGRS